MAQTLATIEIPILVNEVFGRLPKSFGIWLDRFSENHDRRLVAYN